MISRETLNSWYKHKSNKERVIEATEDIDVCEHCNGTGAIEILEHVSGDTVVPGGFWEGSGVYKKCVCQHD